MSMMEGMIIIEVWVADVCVNLYQKQIKILWKFTPSQFPRTDHQTYWYCFSIEIAWFRKTDYKPEWCPSHRKWWCRNHPQPNFYSLLALACTGGKPSQNAALSIWNDLPLLHLIWRYKYNWPSQLITGGWCLEPTGHTDILHLLLQPQDPPPHPFIAKAIW